MKNPPKELDILKKKIEDSFGLIPETKSDYDRLATRISNKLKEVFALEKDVPRVSGTTISRIWEYVKSDVEISKATWSSLARSIGYKGWEDFCSSINSESEIVNNEPVTIVEETANDSSNNSSEDNINNESIITVEKTTLDTSDGSPEDNVTNQDNVQKRNNDRKEFQKHYITDFDIINDTETLGIGDTFYFCERGRYAELEYKGDCEFEIIDHSDKMRINESIMARWFEKIQIKNRNGKTMYEDIAGVLGHEEYDRLYL